MTLQLTGLHDRRITTYNPLIMLDLLDLIGRDVALKRVASTNGGEYAGPCPFCPDGGADRLRVWPKTWRYWCRRCGRKGDAVQYLRDHDGLTFAEAKARAEGTQPLAGPARTLLTAPRPARPAGPPPDAWQQRGRALGAESCAALWARQGAAALAWLRGRGLSDDTIRAAQLGYNAQPGFEILAQWGLPAEVNPDTGKPRKVFVPRGIVIPCEVGGALWYLKIRRVPGDMFACAGCRRTLTEPGECSHCGEDNPKYLQIRGGRPALFGADTMRGKSAAVLCEGELDALLLGQEAGDLAGVATLGSASNRADVADFAEYLLPVGRYLLAYDLDGAGANGAAALASLTRRARRVSVPALPGVKDLTEFHKAGGNLRAWLAFELARLDVPTRRPASPASTPSLATGTALRAESVGAPPPLGPDYWQSLAAEAERLANDDDGADPASTAEPAAVALPWAPPAAEPPDTVRAAVPAAAGADGRVCPVCGRPGCARPLCAAVSAGKSWPLSDLPEVCAELGIDIAGADPSQPGPLLLIAGPASVPAQPAGPSAPGSGPKAAKGHAISGFVMLQDAVSSLTESEWGQVLAAAGPEPESVISDSDFKKILGAAEKAGPETGPSEPWPFSELEDDEGEESDYASNQR